MRPGKVTTCPAEGAVASPFDYAALASTWCWSKINGDGAPGQLISPNLDGHPGFGVNWQFPMLIAAVDPAAEASPGLSAPRGGRPGRAGAVLPSRMSG